MKRLAIIALLTGMTAFAAEAQTKPAAKSKAKTTTNQSAKPAAADPWGTDQAPATTAPATADGTQSQASGADGGAMGGYGGFGAGAADRETRIEGMSVAPGSPLQPGGRVRSDYMGRPIKSKPSMRPRSNRDQDRP